ncbi:MAG: NAD(P)/FAD-dependent oxidoreductase [Burkholderiaceae bacterium]|nr:NAD(P)/FAD-dependent oxidoreductase [Burkholderiaceae bacterium]MBY0238615.1 NAD(P)/FAD-dependent oxidoreductase [Burkholderiaceae bacterium]
MSRILIIGGGLGAWAIGQILQVDGEKVGVIERLERVGVQQTVTIAPLVEVPERPVLALPPTPPWQSARPWLKKKKGRS